MGSIAIDEPDTSILADHYVHKPNPIRVIVIGAGISGIAFTYKAKKIEGLEFQIYEKNPEVGGTWWESRYPGVSCDVPAHCYTYTWVGNPNWSKIYADGSEIEEFYSKLARNYGVYEKTKFEHKVTKAEWDAQASLWRVTVENLSTGETFVDSANVLLNCGGILNNWKWPDIPGLHSFKGDLVHTAVWPEGLDLKDKRIAVVGSGATGIQILPEIQPLAKHLTSFNRSPTWIAPEFAGQFAKEGRATKYSEEQKERFANDPEYFKQYRQEIEHGMNARFPSFFKNTAAQKAAFTNIAASMRQRLKNDPVLCETLIPKFPVGCRRVTPGHGYLEALLEPNVTVVTSGIKEVNEKGIVSNDGKQHEFDIIITATGYESSYVPRFPIIGLNGVNLQQRWKKEGASAYLSCAVPGFPNYFLTTGPNAPISNGSLVGAIEKELDFALAFIRKLQLHDLDYAVVLDEAAKDFDDWKNAQMSIMSWTGACTSWYKNGTTNGKVIGPWPGSVNHFFEIIKNPRWEDFQYGRRDKNRFTYFGNGTSPVEGKQLPLGWYMTGYAFKEGEQPAYPVQDGTPDRF